jgi:hypothetical protein
MNNTGKLRRWSNDLKWSNATNNGITEEQQTSRLVNIRMKQHGNTRGPGTQHFREQRECRKPNWAADCSWRYQHQPVSLSLLTMCSSNLMQNIFCIYRNDGSLLRLLPYAAQAVFNSSDTQHDPLCLPDTRIDVLEQIRAWADGTNKKCIFWLNGFAGTGKSTIARTIARKYYDQNRLGGSFFFSRGGGD